MVDAEVDVTLSNGETLSAVKVSKVRESTRVAGSVLAITILDKTTGKPTAYGAVRIKEICKPGGGPMLVYDGARKALVEPSQVKAKSEEKGDASARLALTDDQQRAIVEKQREFLKKAAAEIPNHGMQLHETKRFLFFTDVPAQNVTTTYVPSLDMMYTRLCALYGLDPNVNIWRGKAPVVVFADRASFLDFERTYFMAPTVENMVGVANLSSNGNVVIAAEASADAKWFATVLVHETTHGFTHRYFEKQQVPSWLNEGLSESVANQVVAGSPGVQRKVERALALMRQSHSMGEGFFTETYIKGQQYGTAMSFVSFLIEFNPKGSGGKSSAKSRRQESANTSFRQFVEKFRSGTPLEKSLQEAYGLPLPELVQRFGQTIGIPDLHP